MAIYRQWQFKADGTIDISVGDYCGIYDRNTERFVIGKDGKYQTYCEPTSREMDAILTNLEIIVNNGKIDE